MNEVIEVPQQQTPSDLLRLAVAGGADVDKLQQLMALQERYLAAQAKRAFDAAFAAFKAEGVRLVKNKTVGSGPLKGSKFAELWTIIDVVTPALSKHGLSTSWKLTKDDKDWLEVTCYLKHVDGHVETAAMGGPPDKREGDAKSPIQARASSKSYLERQTLKAVLGMSEAGDDSDGNGQHGGRDEAAPDAELMAVIGRGDAAAAAGHAAFAEWWASLTAKGRAAVKDRAAGWRQTAQEFDLAHAEPAAARDPFVEEIEKAERRNADDGAPHERGARGAKR